MEKIICENPEQFEKYSIVLTNVYLFWKNLLEYKNRQVKGKMKIQ